jgi:hypothetical protein
MHIRFRGNVFTEPLPSNRRLLWLNYFGFQASCHSIVMDMIRAWLGDGAVNTF